MGTKKAVFSETMGLDGLYGGGERRCERPAVEWSVDSRMQRKIRVHHIPASLEAHQSASSCAENPTLLF
jgi:hypothetical protein